MGVQPPSDDIDDGPDVVEFGIAALDARIGELPVSFPVEKETLISDYGDVSVPVDAAGTELRLADALSDVPVQRFDTEQELLNTLHPVFEERRRNSSRSIIAQLRSLVPF
jgi:hypothetical protein